MQIQPFQIQIDQDRLKHMVFGIKNLLMGGCFLGLQTLKLLEL
jgi:hypothetical protein